jgi:hypothetical protein
MSRKRAERVASGSAFQQRTDPVLARHLSRRHGAVTFLLPGIARSLLALPAEADWWSRILAAPLFNMGASSGDAHAGVKS